MDRGRERTGVKVNTERWSNERRREGTGRWSYKGHEDTFGTE